MTLQGYKHSEETKKKIGEARKGLPSPMLGKTHSEESKRKIGIASRGKRLSEETRKKIGDTLRGTKRPPFSEEWKRNIGNASRGSKHPFWGKHHSEETKRKISEINKGKKLSEETILKISGKNNHNWKGGATPINSKIRNSIEYKLWREAVFKRDSYTCVWCKIKNKRLNADHIKRFSDFPELRFAIDNGRTLCEDCHQKTDTFGGRQRSKKKSGGFNYL